MQRSTPPRALIIGGGIGGMAAGIALRRIGWEVQVFERAPQPAEVGAGLSLWANAIHALDRLGLTGALQELRSPTPEAGIYAWHGEPIMTESLEALAQRLGTISIVAHRAELLELLYQAIGPEHVHFDQVCTGFGQDGTGVSATFADGRRVDGDLLIGADGIRSLVRAGLFRDGDPVYSGYGAFRGIVTFNPRRIRAGEYWGHGARLGLLPMSKGRVYWFATYNGPPGQRLAQAEAYAMLCARFRGWAAPIPELIAATDPARILQNDIADRPPLPHWSSGRVTLLGDAAHPTTPNLGQGACQALEDAVVLADALQQHPDIPTALRHYERLRIPRTRMVVQQSRMIGMIGQWSNPLACRLRNRVFRTFIAPSRAAAIDPIIGYRV
jgi:2-polyprenyl-6-methoxyphenol hydroxylase-like FAD-dependent oxidoreductase